MKNKQSGKINIEINEGEIGEFKLEGSPAVIISAITAIAGTVASKMEIPLGELLDLIKQTVADTRIDEYIENRRGTK